MALRRKDTDRKIGYANYFTILAFEIRSITMKKLQSTHYFWICLLSLCTVASLLGACKKDDEEEEEFGAMSAVVDNIPWRSKADSAIIYNGNIYIRGIAGNGEKLEFFLKADVEDNYILDDSMNYAQFTKPQFKKYPYTTLIKGKEGRGFFTVTDIDTAHKVISGVFEMSAYTLRDGSMINITNGVFTNMRYLGSPEVNKNNKLNCKIGDTLNYTGFAVAGTKGAGQLLIGGIDKNGHAVQIYIPDTLSAGVTSPISLTGPSRASFTYYQSTDAWRGKSGQVKVISHNKSTKIIEGNFNFTAQSTNTSDTTLVTGGFFHIEY